LIPTEAPIEVWIRNTRSRDLLYYRKNTSNDIYDVATLLVKGFSKVSDNRIKPQAVLWYSTIRSALPGCQATSPTSKGQDSQGGQSREQSLIKRSWLSASGALSCNAMNSDSEPVQRRTGLPCCNLLIATAVTSGNGNDSPTSRLSATGLVLAHRLETSPGSTCSYPGSFSHGFP